MPFTVEGPPDVLAFLKREVYPEYQKKVCRFANDMATAHAQWVEVETRPLRVDGQPVIKHLLRHNAFEAWERMQSVDNEKDGLALPINK